MGENNHDKAALAAQLRDLFKPKEVEVRPSEDLVRRYRVFQEATGATVGVVYHPCGGADSSPSAAFPESRVIYAELDESCAQALTKAGLEAHHASALEFDPGPVDVLILVNPTISPDIPARFVIPGGHVVCNNYHGTASHLNTDTVYTLQGVIVPEKEGQFTLDQDNLPDYFAEVETDDEWKKARGAFGGMRYETAAKIVKAVTGKTDNILVEYRRLVAQARQQELEARARLRAEDPTFPEFEESNVYMLNHEGRQHVLSATLPCKKGSVDDLYVYQKKIDPEK